MNFKCISLALVLQVSKEFTSNRKTWISLVTLVKSRVTALCISLLPQVAMNLIVRMLLSIFLTSLILMSMIIRSDELEIKLKSLSLIKVCDFHLIRSMISKV